MTLSCSRHQYAEIVFDQTIATWLRLHRAAFEFFGGVPRRVVLDNLRAAIVHAALYEIGRASCRERVYVSVVDVFPDESVGGRAGGEEERQQDLQQPLDGEHA